MRLLRSLALLAVSFASAAVAWRPMPQPPSSPPGTCAADSADSFVPAPPRAAPHKPLFSPYLESYKPLDLRKVPCQSVTLAFLLGTPAKKLAWDGTMPLNEWQARVKASGKKVVLAFGGAAGTELAQLERDPSRLAKAYVAAAKAYGAARLDFDIEGSNVADASTNSLRNRALKLAQQRLPGVALQYTLPVMPHGLDEFCLELLRDAKKQGVKLHTVNVMAMDYGGSYLGDMGGYAIEAARATRRQLAQLGMGDVGVGITPMIGQNDVQGEVFTLSDARQIAAFAAENAWVTFVGFWAVGRDNGRMSWLADASMLTQKDYAFTKTFARALE